MINLDTTTPASVAQQGAPVAPVKASSKKQAAARNHAPKPRKPAKGAKPKKSATTKVRPGSKSAKVMALLARTNGASLAELMKETQWQAHSIRGFLSTASRKRNLPIESFKNGKGNRSYRLNK